MEKALREYTRWTHENLPEDLMTELEAICGDEREIYDRFCKDISFGTSGMRGKMGVGSNRINSLTLCRASLGLAEYLWERYESPTIAIAYDTRINSHEYAERIAEVFADKGVGVYIFDEPTPVPVLSFTVRDMRLHAGIMITASHNPKDYNGYKVYDGYGNQIDDRTAAELEAYISRHKFHVLAEREQTGKNQRKILRISKEIKQRYLDALDENTPRMAEDSIDEVGAADAISELKICYTPLNGTGRTYVLETLSRLGLNKENITEVETQKKADGNFETCPYPNPERATVFEEAMRVCEEQKDKPQLILATDPDSDRLGVMCLSTESDNYIHLSGNQIGELLLNYVCECGDERKKHRTAFKSFVSSPLTEEIAAAHGVQMRSVFTGFKNIASGIQRLEEKGEGEFVFGFEESLGYLCGNYTRDKDGIMAARLVCLVAAKLMREGKTLEDGLEEIYRRYGYQEAAPFAIEYESERDRFRVAHIMKAAFTGKFKKYIEQVCEGFSVKKELCYRQQNMYNVQLDEGHSIIIRPSGTESKLKIYVFARGNSRAEAQENAQALRKLTMNFLEQEKNKTNDTEVRKYIGNI